MDCCDALEKTQGLQGSPGPPLSRLFFDFGEAQRRQQPNNVWVGWLKKKKKEKIHSRLQMSPFLQALRPVPQAPKAEVGQTDGGDWSLRVPRGQVARLFLAPKAARGWRQPSAT